MTNNQRTRAFTLIELLVVIAIIGLLSSVVLASLNTARVKGRDARRLADIKQLQNALTLYADANGSLYPSELSTTTIVTPGYMPAVPVDPSTGAPYLYAGIGATDCSSYHIGATLEDTAHKALSADMDTSGATVCTGSAADFDGTDPVYDTGM